MKNKLRLLIITLFFFFTTQSYSNPINKINFIGLNNTSEELLLQSIPFQVGQEYSSDLSSGIIESLFKTGLFSDISISKNESSLDITLKENSTIKYFEINLDTGSGFSNWLNGEKILFSSEALDEELSNYLLSPGNPFTKQKLDKFIQVLQSKYSESGYYNATFTPIISVDELNRAGIDLKINQGDRVKIDSFKITGTENIDEDTLLKLFKIGEADMLLVNYFTKKDLFTEAEFAQGIELLKNKYFDLGYLDFRILNVETKLDEQRDNISINIEIDEGIQYILGKVSFDGELGSFNLETLNSKLSMNEGDIFNRNVVIQDIQKLTDLFADEGYAFVDINPITSDFQNSVNINFNVSLNKKVYINRITISGNTRTQDEVVRREIGISEGGLYSRSVLRDSLINLRRLGYFSDVQISTSEVQGMPDKINISFIVKETQTGAVSFSVSHSNNFGISFGAGIKEKNIFGSGNTLNADLSISESFNRLSFYFMNPNYNDEGHSLSFGAFRSEINDDDVAKNSYEINTTGASFGYGIPMASNTKLNTEIEFSNNEIKCSALFSGVGYESSQCASSK
ncbi:outer membrane protein assembly factor BamA, partial [Candidatus Thioglobus sp.]|nr:outer membrane protein assembly factor BamA [Candidatus Thioglobus sp.]